MLLVQVELGSPVQVQDLISFLLSRSYNNFRVIDRGSIPSGNVCARISTRLSQSLNGPFCQSPSTEDIHSARDAAARSELRELLTEAPNTSNGADELDLFKQKPAEEDMEACVVLPNAGSLLHSESPDSMAEDDTMEHGLSLENPSVSQDVSHIESKRENSSEVNGGFCGDPFNVKWIRNAVRSLRERGVLKDRVRCAICKMDVVAFSGYMCKHINIKHTNFICTVVQFATTALSEDGACLDISDVTINLRIMLTLIRLNSLSSYEDYEMWLDNVYNFASSGVLATFTTNSLKTVKMKRIAQELFFFFQASRGSEDGVFVEMSATND
ncbi:hypothetical protein KIN20_022553 [Parelaphostrongylus tenuis]|uniref:Uncharacterized protein n=1 Tax=Parelaphostrongylus tenuis TaxID=148309 RepID=A0AAD5MVN9_PARTN|nr:hypothetical protein KIN20_022553 [Parelaphostrongylus tenuis]